MHNSRRSTLACALALALTLVAFLGVVAPAYGVMEDDPKAVSSTNPYDPGDRDAFWRHGWGTSYWPHIEFTGPGQDSLGTITLPTLGFYYTFDRDPNGVPAVGGPDISADEAGPHFSHSFDLRGIYAALPADKRDYVPAPGEKISNPLEGPWYLHVRFYNEYRTIAESSTMTYHFGLDVTPPYPVTNFAAGTVIPVNGGSTVAVTQPTETRRRILTWDAKQYDGLSGVGLFRVLLDGKEKILVPVTLFNIPNTVTIEDMPAGTHTLSVQVLDRATNTSTLVSQKSTVDYDKPSVSITSPYSGQGVYGTRKFTVKATDLAGNPFVGFQIDGKWMGSDATPPYELTVDTTKLSKGAHTFTAIAKDVFGHYVGTTRSFNVDNVPIGFQNVGDSPDPFYPRYKDGYKDGSKVSYWLTKSAKRVWVRIWSGSKVVREYTGADAGIGWHSTTWDGKKADGSMAEGTYYYQIVAMGYNGATWSSGKYPTTIRYWELVRIAPNMYKVVPR